MSRLYQHKMGSFHILKAQRESKCVSESESENIVFLFVS